MKNQEIVIFLISLIEKYKSNAISKETFYHMFEDYFLGIDLEYLEDDLLKYVLEHLIPDACLFYIVEPGEWYEKETLFRQEILECEKLLRESLVKGEI